MNDSSELQAIDFSLGAHICGAFAGYADTGPQHWKEFIQRPLNKQVIRHDADSPQEFLQAFLGAQKGKATTPTEATVNSALLPIVYYFRKPGFTNTMDQKSSKGVVTNLTKPFKLLQLPLSLDYSIGFIAWDKPTLDKVLLAWYAWITQHGFFPTRYQIGTEEFDMRATVQDNNNVILSNASFTTDGNRIYAATSTYSINTNVLIGQEVTIPIQRLIFGFAHEPEERYVLTTLIPLQYGYDSATRPEGTISFNPGTVQILDGTTVVATDDGHGVFDTGMGIGTLDYYNGTADFGFTDAPVGVVSISFAPLQGRAETT